MGGGGEGGERCERRAIRQNGFPAGARITLCVIRIWCLRVEDDVDGNDDGNETKAPAIAMG